MRHISRRIVAGPVVLIVMALLVAGCGSSAGSNDKPRTAAQYRSSLNAFCKSLISDASASRTVSSITNSSAPATTKLSEIITFTAGYYRKVLAITPPSGDSAAEKLNSDFRTFIADGRTMVSAAKAGNTAGIARENTTMATLESSINTDFDSVGASACSAS